MVKHDGSLILMGADTLDSNMEANEKKFLRLHPSYEI